MRILFLFISFLANLRFYFSQICFVELSHFSIPRTNEFFPNISYVENSMYFNEPPAFVALPTKIEQVKQALECASRNNIKVSVKAGGHSFGGYSSIAAPGFMINMGNMKNVTWTGEREVTVQAGARWHDVYQTFRSHGGNWVVTGGLCPSVGVAGYTLGGGVGPCSRKFGMAIDNVIRFKMLTANGSHLVTADENKNADLFWALRGSGGGNFGVVVEITFKVHHGPKWQTWGTICYPKNETFEAYKKLGEIQTELPHDINIDAVMNPDLCLWVIFLGHKNDTFKVLEPILSNPRAQNYKLNFTEYDCWWEMIEAHALAHGYPKDDSGNTIPFIIRSGLVKHLSKGLSHVMSNIDMPKFCSQHLIHFGGKISEVNKFETPFWWRDSVYMIYADCSFTNDSDKALAFEFIKRWWSQVTPYVNGSYVNYMDRYLPNWKLLYFGGNYHRLVKIKKSWNPYDNDGPLHFNQEIDSHYETDFDIYFK